MSDVANDQLRHSLRMWAERTTGALVDAKEQAHPNQPPQGRDVLDLLIEAFQELENNL